MASFKRPLLEPSSGDELEQTQKPRKRATVYDAVAGRVSQWGYIDPDEAKYNAQPLRPDELLYRARNAPVRYEEMDHYFAHRKLPADEKLPSSDLLSALHAYVSEFYGRSEVQTSQKVWKSMDETALIALGILMEETAREVLGDTGHLAFLEGHENTDDAETSIRDPRKLDSLGRSMGASEEEVIQEENVQESSPQIGGVPET